MNRTTNLNELRQSNKFTWGNIIRFYDVGPYVIAEYNPWFRDVAGQVHVGDFSNEIYYHIWVDGRDSCRSSCTLEGALAEAMAYKHDGINSQAGMFFTRMIGIS
jgi:hypothetical protein